MLSCIWSLEEPHSWISRPGSQLDSSDDIGGEKPSGNNCLLLYIQFLTNLLSWSSLELNLLLHRKSKQKQKPYFNYKSWLVVSESVVWFTHKVVFLKSCLYICDSVQDVCSERKSWSLKPGTVKNVELEFVWDKCGHFTLLTFIIFLCFFLNYKVETFSF